MGIGIEIPSKMYNSNSILSNYFEKESSKSTSEDEIIKKANENISIHFE